jgi:hypothetical protein
MIPLLSLAAGCDDSFDPAVRSITKTWDAGPAPKVHVDLFAGYIDVVQSTDGEVSAVITTSGVFKNSQGGPDAALNGIAISATHEGDTIHIGATNPCNLYAIHLRTDVSLRVPPGASLDLLTGQGFFHIGQCLGGPNGNQWTSAPVALKSLRAMGSGGWFTGTEAEILSNPLSPATVLDLESRWGPIRIKGDNLLVKANVEGAGIEYTGWLAPGTHSFVTRPIAGHVDAVRGIRLVVPTAMAFEVDAVSARDQVRVGFPLTSTAPRNPGVVTGRVGADPRVKLDLRSEDGPIEILPDARGMP